MVRLRGFVACLFTLFATLVGASLAFGSRLFDRTGDLVIDLARLWSRSILAVGGVRLDIETRAPLDPGRPYVFMSNHLSAVDIWALYAALPVRLRMLAKKQLGQIPIFGWAMRAGRFIFIDRANAVSARRSIDEAKARVKGGQSVLLFPEGTRSRTGELGPFKKGGFHLAIGAGVPIVPIAIVGAWECMPPGQWLLRAGRVRIVIGTPVPTEQLGEQDKDALLTRVRGEIERMIAEGSGRAESPRADSALNVPEAAR